MNNEPKLDLPLVEFDVEAPVDPRLTIRDALLFIIIVLSLLGFEGLILWGAIIAGS